MIRLHLRSTLFPYTTLFRSVVGAVVVRDQVVQAHRRITTCHHLTSSGCRRPSLVVLPAPRVTPRSEEHTSELQSHSDLVCRLLLEKKKKNKRKNLREIITLS